MWRTGFSEPNPFGPLHFANYIPVIRWRELKLSNFIPDEFVFLRQKENEAKDQSFGKGLEFPKETRRANARDGVRKRAPRTVA